MCELLGFSSRKRRRRNDLLREFYSHAETHPHGWGLARFLDGGVPSVEKEPVCATCSEHLKRLLAEPVEDRAFIAHIRLATVGHIEYENCHPFTATDNSGRVWTLAHNGTIFNGPELNDYIGIQYGDTDSERVLLHLVDRINVAQNHLGHGLNEAERFDALYAMIAELSRGNKLNLLIHDGELLYAHCNFRDALHVWRDTDGVAFSTRPLSMGTWTPVPFTSLVAVKNGEIVRTSPPHGNEYVYNPEDYRLVYMNFARL